MKIKIAILTLVLSGLIVSLGAQADNHTISIGYAQSKVQDFSHLRGVNVQYRYEWDSPVSILGSFSFMKADESGAYRIDTGYGISGYDEKADVKYYSLLAGPAYRINDYFSIYALAGLAHTKVNDKIVYLGGYTEEFNSSSTDFAYGVGVVVNPVENISINVGYEGSRIKGNDDSASVNGFNLGIGYRF